MDVPTPEIVIFVFGMATTEKATFAARLYNPSWVPVSILPHRYWGEAKLLYHNTPCMVVDTPGFDHENTYSYDNFQAVEALLKRYVQRMGRNQQGERTTAPVRFSAIYCYPMTSDQLGSTTRRDLQALVALCKFFDFDSFSIVPVWPLSIPADQQQFAVEKLCKHQQIEEIYRNGVQVLFDCELVPKNVIGFIISNAAPFNRAREGENWTARLAYDKARLRTQPVDHDRAQELEIEQLKLRLKQVEDVNNSLLQSLSLPAYNLERKTLAKEFDDLNREISRIIKGIAKHCGAERTVGVDRLLVEPAQLDAMHNLLSNGHGDRSSASLYHSNTSRHMSVKLFLQSAAALIICEALHEQVFQPFHPGLLPEMNEVLCQTYQNVRDKNNDTMSGKWRHDTFVGLQETLKQHEEMQSAISSHIKESVYRLLQTLFGALDAISPQQQAAFSNFDQPFAPFDGLVQKALELNHKIKADAVLIGSFRTMYYPPGTIFDSHLMSVGEAIEDQDEEETQKQERTQANEHTIYSTFGLGLAITSGDQVGANVAEQGHQLTIINRTIVIDESSCDVTYREGSD